MEVKTLSSFPGTPFNDTFETFLDTYSLSEDIECYQLLFCPYGTGTSFNNLYEIDFQSKVVILNIMDLMIDQDDNTAIQEIKKFCEDHPEQNFIIFNLHLNLKNELNLPNLYLDTIIPTGFTEKLNHCEKKEITNKWLSLNSDTKLHKVMTVSYLLSKDYYDNGNITFRFDVAPVVTYHKYKNITSMPQALRSSFSRGYGRFKRKDFNLLKIRNFDQTDDRVANNYNVNLLPVYETTGVEIITGSMFFEKTPALSEKELQSIYAKNFPIYINGPGIVKGIKELLDIDVFDDIIDHSYDEIEGHFERLTAAIDRNEHLLNGSTNIQELWLDNQKRFEDNCSIMDSFIHDKENLQRFNHQKIQNALTHFEISSTKV